MSTALEDQLAEARSQIESLQSDNQAQADLLTEASTTQEQLRGEVETLSAQAESLTAQVTNLTAERDSALGQVTSLNARVAELEASQADFDAEVARVVASTGHTPPAQVTPAGDGAPSAKPTLEELVAQYDQLVSDRKPEEAAKFFDEHLAQHFNR